jgi:hypothetical protein
MVLDDQYEMTLRVMQSQYSGRINGFLYENAADAGRESEYSGTAYPQTGAFSVTTTPPLDANLYSLVQHEANHVVGLGVIANNLETRDRPADSEPPHNRQREMKRPDRSAISGLDNADPEGSCKVISSPGSSYGSRSGSLKLARGTRGEGRARATPLSRENQRVDLNP